LLEMTDSSSELASRPESGVESDGINFLPIHRSRAFRPAKIFSATSNAMVQPIESFTR
jgi:hypothetical protein